MKYTPFEHHIKFTTDWAGKPVVVIIPYSWIQAMAAKAANSKSGRAIQSATRTESDPVVAKVVSR